MLRLTVTADELVAYGRALERVPALLRSEMQTATQAVVADGVALAQEYAPFADGDLRNSIGPISSGVDGLSGEFGTSAIHAMQREYGGTITPKNGKFLVFPGRNGGLVFARSVTQSGSFYMRSTFVALVPRMYLAYQRAVNRAIAAAGAW